MLNLEALHIFLAINEHGSFSEAGRRLHKSQPAISQVILNLEKQLGSPLFTRDKHPVGLTESGQALLPMARELLTHSHRVEETLLSFESEMMGEINIGCSTASGKYLLPRLISRFRTLHPHVRVNIIIRSRDSIVRKINAGELAMGITSKQIDQPGLEYLDFFTDTVILIVPANHRWAQYRKIRPDDLLDEAMILREAGAGTREVLIENLRRHDIVEEMLNIAMVLGNTEAIEIAVEEGLGIAFVSRLAASRGLEMGRVVEVEVENMILARNIYLFRNRNSPLTKTQAEIWDFIQNNHTTMEKCPVALACAAVEAW
jgi:DNA-binding transcriptional LysR family regulator